MPVIYATPKLDVPERRVLAMLDNLRARIRSATGSDGATRRWLGPLRRNLAARALRGSNSIEGINFSMDDANALVADEEPLDDRTEHWLTGQGWKRAMTYVLQAGQDADFSYDENVIKSLHFMMLEHEMDKRPGRWREGPVFVVNDVTGNTVYEGPDPESIPALVGELVESLRRSEGSVPSVVLAAMAHLNLVMIHPFKDGNGRMARCLQSLVLARQGQLSPVFMSIEEYLGRNTPAYYRILEETGLGQWNPGRDTTPWVRFCLVAHFIQASTVANRVKMTQQGWTRIEERVASLGLPDRGVVPLVDAFMGWRIRNQFYRAATEVSEQVATSDLARFTKAGLLEAHGEKRARTYTRGPLLKEILEEVRFRPVIPDPFGAPDEAEAFSAEGLVRQPFQPE